ncbi:MAG: SusC/RagA family TonB-linked outer membrane protein, partial [Bacteroidales bacterium]|nr:SusC/RagA family TonB-linked outer membrane protein [Bacteroidales bacterium]
MIQAKKLLRTALVCVMTVASSALAFAQTNVSGTVLDPNGQPIVGATVMVVGTLNGTQTDFEGKYALKVANPESSTLQFSCLGYNTVDESIGTRSVVNVTMPENAEALEETVVIGYGTQKKVNLTGSVSSVNYSDLAQNRTILSNYAALAGTVPGMMVLQTDSQPGSEATTIRIRGTGSFTSSASSPLVLVDGIEWSMDSVNPSDIESVSVLKDAASTAIYGTRAANGVILVTTKSGAEEKPRITYSYNASWQQAYNKVKWVSNYADYMDWLNEACDNANVAHQFSDETINLWIEKTADPNGLNEYGVPNYMAYPNTDWFDAIFNTGFTQKHDISISGGSRTVRYLVSGSYLNNEGVMSCSGLDSGQRKGTFRANLEADVTKWFTLGAKLYGEIYNLGNASVSNAFKYLYATTPGVYPGTENKYGQPISSIGESASVNNLLYQQHSTTGTKYTWKLNGNIYAKIRPYKGVSLEASVDYAPQFMQNHTYTQENIKWDYTTNTSLGSSTNLDTATVTDYNGRNYRASVDLLARYDTTINKDHTLGVLLGYSTYNYLAWSTSVTSQGATDWTLNDGSSYSTLYNSSYSPRSGYGLRSYFARVNYGYKDRYLFEANFRADGSSVFGTNTRYGFFPSFSAGWKIHEEPWMQSASKWLSELKLRASWGETGNNQGIGNYTWQSTYTSGSVVIDGSTATALYIASMSNINLKWETTSTTDIGVDFGFFNNRLTGSVDYYYKGTRDILYTPSTYLTMGDFTQVPSNLGRLWNQGVEIALNWKDTVGDFFYYAGVNFSFNKNMVTKFKGALVEGMNDGVWETNYSDVAEDWNAPGVLLEGHEIGEHYILKLYNGTGAGYSGGTVDVNAGPKDGMIRTEADMAWVQAMIDAGYTFQGGSTLSKDQLWYGDFVYADLNGDGNYGNTYDKYFTGHSSVPSYNLGVNFGLSWKGLEFSMVWAGAFDYYLNWNSDYYNVSVVKSGYAIPQRIADDHYFYDPENHSDSR